MPSAIRNVLRDDQAAARTRFAHRRVRPVTAIRGAA